MTTYGLIGKILGHSFSKDFFREKFIKEQIDAQYLNFEIPEIDNFPDIIKNNTSIKGLNVTIPYKTDIIKYLDDISDEAKEIGAVNVIKITRDKNGSVFLKGHNTDTIGFTKSISKVAKYLSVGASVLVLESNMNLPPVNAPVPPLP